MVVDAGDLHWKQVSFNINSNCQVKNKLPAARLMDALYIPQRVENLWFYKKISNYQKQYATLILDFCFLLHLLKCEMKQIVAKMKSKHMGGTFTKKKKCMETNSKIQVNTCFNSPSLYPELYFSCCRYSIWYI